MNASLFMQAKMHGLPWADFHEIQECLTELCADRIYCAEFQPNWTVNVESADRN